MWRFSLLVILLPACNLADDGLIKTTCEDLPIDCSEVDLEDTDTEVDLDADGYAAGVDCDDDDPEVHPDADEVCDEIDNDCDESIDEEDDSLVDGLLRYIDADGDGYGLEGSESLICEESSGFVDNDEDCDDEEASTYPDAEEICDGVDSDCDGREASGIVTTNDENYQSISMALNAAPTGARITICDGQWQESLVIYDSVSLVSLGGAENTELRPSDDGGAIIEIYGGDLTIEGFTLRDGQGSAAAGWGSSGGAIYVGGGSLTLRDSLLTGNSAVIGAAIFGDEGAESITIEDSVIESNTASQYCGAIFSYIPLAMSETLVSENSSLWCGAIGGYGSDIQISGGVISDNDATYDGGGIWGMVTSMTLSGVEISGNFAGGHGGGVYLDAGSVSCEASTSITRNAASSDGGGLFIMGVVVNGCSISSNTASYGGGVAINAGQSYLTDSQVQDNTAISWGGGVYVVMGAADLEDVTLESNAASFGAGLYVISDGEVDMSGGSVISNTAVTLGGGLRLASGSVTATSTDFGDGAEDNSPDDIAVSGLESSYTGLGSDTDFICTVQGSSTTCAF